jgi:ComF family protein
MAPRSPEPRTGAGAALAGAWRRTLDLVFPPHCLGCGAFGAFLCDDCLAAVPRAAPPRCPVCWMQGMGVVCSRCRARPPAFDAARCPFVYQGAARDAVHALKYDGVSALAKAMAEPMADCLSHWSPQVAALVPVPLTGARERGRGYNQSELLARELGRLTGLPVAGRALTRRRGGPAQARAADEATRRATVAAAFLARPRDGDPGPLFLIDDVMTSGATLDACARALAQARLGPVYALTFARED